MHRIFLPFVALFLLPALAVEVTGKVLSASALESVVLNLPPASWILASASALGAAPANPIPILAAAVGIGTFLLSSVAYSQATTTNGDELMQTKLYLKIISRLASLIFLAFGGTFALTYYYMRLSLQMSLILSVLAMIGAYRLILDTRWQKGQGQGTTTAAEAEAQRGNI